MAAISDSSPLILYERIGRLDLLRVVFGGVLIPFAVHQEVFADRAGHRSSDALVAARWITTQSLAVLPSEYRWFHQLDRGEAEAIALAIELGRQIPVLLDDLAGRRVARDLALPVYGSAGILVLAKRRGQVASIREDLERLRAAGLYLSDAIFREALVLAGDAAGTG